jgi:hypothetical protein
MLGRKSNGPSAFSLSGLGVTVVIRNGCNYYDPLDKNGCSKGRFFSRDDDEKEPTVNVEKF